MTNLVINSQAISTHDGLFSLNDLHKVSGNDKNHQPSNFMANKETKDLIHEIESENAIAYHTINGGKNRGTYACRELVYRYAMWISPKFSLMVIRAFDAMNTGAIPCLPPKSTANDRTPLRQAVTALCGKLGIMHPEAYALVHQYMGVEHIDEIALDDLPRAVEYVHRLMIHSETKPTINTNFIQNVLLDTIFQTKKAKGEMHSIVYTIKCLLNNIEEVQDRLELSERYIEALQQRFTA